MARMDARFVIREARKRAGLTQAELAARAGTTQSAIARWESGAVSPSVESLDRILSTCGMRGEIVMTATDDRDQDLIAERLRMTPEQRLHALLDGLRFEHLARKARRVGRTRDRFAS